jgi:cytochrome c-type biogenesis protein CcmH
VEIKVPIRIIVIAFLWNIIVPVLGTGNIVMAQSGESEVSLSEIEEIADVVMSPGCDYKYTLSNCPSVQAIELKELIEGKLLAGESKEEIIQYLLDLYGPRVLAAPEKRGFYLLAWWVPYFVIADGALIAALLILFWKKRAQKKAASAVEEDPETLHAYEDKVEDELKRMDF